MVSDIYAHLTSVLDKHALKKEKSVVVRPIQPWFTDELHQAKNERRKAERLWRRTGLTVHKEIYRAEKCKYNTLLQDSKATTSMKESQNVVMTQKLFQKL